MRALDMEIREEMNTGLNGLHRRYQHLFQGTICSRLASTAQQKQMWIMSIWAAQDNTEEEYNGRQQNEDLEMIYRRWKKQNKRNLDK